jgi:hypothetical protein
MAPVQLEPERPVASVNSYGRSTLQTRTSQAEWKRSTFFQTSLDAILARVLTQD